MPGYLWVIERCMKASSGPLYLLKSPSCSYLSSSGCGLHTLMSSCTTVLACIFYQSAVAHSQDWCKSNLSHLDLARSSVWDPADTADSTLIVLKRTFTGDSEGLHHVNIASVCCRGSLCVSVGLTVSVIRTELQLDTHEEVHMLLFSFQSHLPTRTCSVSPTQHLSTPLALLASMCMPVLDTVSQSIYFSWIYIDGMCDLLCFLFLLNYARVCVLDPAVVHCSPCTNWTKPLNSNKSRFKKNLKL